MSLTITDVHPVDDRYGMGRGVPIARHYINRYFEKISTRIHGSVLEFGQPTYAAGLDCRYETMTIDENETFATLHTDICDEAVIRVRQPLHEVRVFGRLAGGRHADGQAGAPRSSLSDNQHRVRVVRNASVTANGGGSRYQFVGSEAAARWRALRCPEKMSTA